MFPSRIDGRSGSSCACGSGTNLQGASWPSLPQLGSVAGGLDIRTESSEFSLSRSLNALLPEDVKLESIQDFRSSTESATSLIRIFSRDSLPPYPVTAKAIDKFYLSTGQLFYIIEEREARELLKTVYTEPQNTTLPMFCVLFATAAVGSQYDDLVPHAVKQSFLQTTRFYLDDYLEADDFQTVRILLLLAIFCVLDKRTACWKYIETFIDIPSNLGQGLQSAHSRGIHLSDEPIVGYSKDEWVGWRKTWRSLVFLDSWLAGTLGLLPSVDPVIAHNCIEEKDYHDVGNSISSSLQLNLIKLGVLLGKILYNVFRNSTADLCVVSDHMIQLEHWHESLPPLLQLQALVSTDIEPMKKAMVYLMHCTYLTAIILLTRRVMVPLVSGDGIINDWLAAGKMKEAIAYAEVCVYASKQVAKVVGLLHSERLLTKKCWMAIYPAFNAGLILLFHISQQVLKGHHYDQFSEDIADARKCISALEYCAQDDEASRCYLVILRPFRELLSRSPGEAREMLQPPEPQCSPPTSPQSQWGSMYSVLADVDGVSSSPPPNFSPTSSSPPNSSPSNTLDSTSTPVSSTKRMCFEYSSVHHNPRWTDFHSLPKVNVQQPSADDGKRKYSAKDMEDLEALLRRVA